MRRNHRTFNIKNEVRERGGERERRPEGVFVFVVNTYIDTRKYIMLHIPHLYSLVVYGFHQQNALCAGAGEFPYIALWLRLFFALFLFLLVCLILSCLCLYATRPLPTSRPILRYEGRISRSGAIAAFQQCLIIVLGWGGIASVHNLWPKSWLVNLQPSHIRRIYMYIVIKPANNYSLSLCMQNTVVSELDTIKRKHQEKKENSKHRALIQFRTVCTVLHWA